MADLEFLGMESNPEVFSDLLHSLGVPDQWAVNEVLGLEPDLLGFVPSPVVSVILLFPSKPVFKAMKQEHLKRIEEQGNQVPENIFFLKQGKSLGDACGTIALIHSVANNAEKLDLQDGPLREFMQRTNGMDFVARGEQLAKDKGIHEAHSKFVVQGQTATTESGTTGHHFVAFTTIQGSLFELDGAKGFPINRGACSDDELLFKAAEIIRKEWMERDPEEVRFSIMAISPSE